MKNVTISMDEELAREVRVEAAKAGQSMSKFIAQTMAAALKEAASAGEGRRDRQAEAMERFLAGPGWSVLEEDGRMPTAEERNARR